MDLGKKTSKKKLKLPVCVLVLVLFASANAAPQPDANPDPNAEPEANYGPPVISSNPMAISPISSPSYSPGISQQVSPIIPPIGPDACGLSKQCCGITEQCYGYSGCNEAPPQANEKKCFSKWEKRCIGEGDDTIRGITKVKNFCVKVRTKDCRLVPEMLEREVQSEVCFPKPLTQVFTYQKKSCQGTAPQQKTIYATWTNDKLNAAGHETKPHCVKVKTFNCREEMKNVNRNEQVPYQYKQPYTRQVCKVVRIPGSPGVPQVKTITRTKYRKECYEVPVEPKCTQTPCMIGGGNCFSNQSPCSLNEFKFDKVCGHHGHRGKREADADAQYDSSNSYADRPDWPVEPLGPGGIQPIQPLGPGGIQRPDWQPLEPLGPGGIQPIAPLGPGGMQPIAPLGPGGMQPIAPLGPGGIQPIAPLGPGGMQPIAPLGPGGIRSPCSMVRQPVCSRNVGGPCLRGAQQCCQAQSKSRRVCRRVPYTVNEQVTIPGIPTRDQFKKECRDVKTMVDRTGYKTVTKTDVFKTKKCDPEFKTVCHKLNIPKFTITSESKRGMVTVMVNAPQCTTVTERYSHTFADGDVDCRPEMVKQQLKINKVKCDQDKEKEYCFPIPYTEMEKIPGAPKCKMVQKQVCVDVPTAPKCQHPPNQMCNVCDSFRRDSGFDSCPTNNCGTYIPGGMWGDGGKFNYPGVSGGGGIVPIDNGGIGGQGGYFPGSGGGGCGSGGGGCG